MAPSTNRIGVFVAGPGGPIQHLSAADTALFRNMLRSVPLPPSQVRIGTSHRLREVAVALGYNDRIERADVLGDDGEHTTLSEDEANQLRALISGLPNDFALIGDPCCIRAFDPGVTVRQLAVYLIQCFVDRYAVTLLATGGQVVRSYVRRPSPPAQASAN